MTELSVYYERLRAHFGHQNWWPGDSPWEIAVGAILVQNTNWENASRAIQALKEKEWLSPEYIVQADAESLAPVIRTSGYFNQKAKKLKALAAWWQAYAMRIRAGEQDLRFWRQSLLAVKGIGPETSDSILLYAFDQLIFVVDAYTRRLLERHQLTTDTSYEAMQAFFERKLPADLDLYQDFHAQIVMTGKHFCRPKPQCEACPLRDLLPRKSSL